MAKWFAQRCVASKSLKRDLTLAPRPQATARAPADQLPEWPETKPSRAYSEKQLTVGPDGACCSKTGSWHWDPGSQGTIKLPPLWHWNRHRQRASSCRAECHRMRPRSCCHALKGSLPEQEVGERRARGWEWDWTLAQVILRSLPAWPSVTQDGPTYQAVQGILGASPPSLQFSGPFRFSAVHSSFLLQGFWVWHSHYLEPSSLFFANQTFHKNVPISESPSLATLMGWIVSAAPCPQTRYVYVPTLCPNMLPNWKLWRWPWKTGLCRYN